jgi:Flp pilus assembly protein CpaB
MTPLLGAFRRRLAALRRRLLLHRRALAALSGGAAVMIGLQAVSPPPPPQVEVWTASRALPAGAVVQGADLVRIRFAPGSVPEGAVRHRAEVVGRTLAAPVARGEPVTGLRTMGPGLLRGYPGATAVPLRITDADTVGLLRVGDRVSIVAADPEGRQKPEELLDDVPVVAVPGTPRGGSTSSTPGRLVVVAVASSEATDVAARAAGAILIPVWKR